ncbi:protocadherin beta-16-like isoform X9 [Denticeps clupeoides]|uniref:protocadherin beta-16-like isoform X9 n=1 Tax=Denticeps clupeoides TaxID=299321 RepID=UPI0010A380CA|nr:protocadherin beta-16-like isoform X9 [Denticeps clupeoides]
MEYSQFFTIYRQWRTGLYLKRQVLLIIIFIYMPDIIIGQARYSIPEEMPEGSVVGNIAKDLGLEITRLVSGKARIVTKGSRQYVELNRDKGILMVKERIDREELCKQTVPCSFSFEVIIENPIQLYRVTVEVRDINDNAPVFPRENVHLEISENAASGTRFSVESAVDLDVGVNGVQNYALKMTDHFKLEIQSKPDGRKFVEMILQNQLDREKQEDFTMLLIASDGGDPQKSGTVRIHVTVLDINDNAPVCERALYNVEILENSPVGTVITTIKAHDADKGSYGHVSYLFAHASAETSDLFEINAENGEIRLLGKLDYENEKKYEIHVKAKDQGGFADTCNVILEIIDENDNSPTIQLMSFSNTVPENAPPGSTIAVINVEDADAGKNGLVQCSINQDIPFKIESSLSDYYTLVTDGVLDREYVPEYNITILAMDQGVPKRRSNKTVTVKVSDINDNSPSFPHSEYQAVIVENNSPGVSVFTVKANDADSALNARLTYFLSDSDVGGTPVSLLVSVNPDSGVIQALRSYDYEQMKWFKFNVTARDGGSPPLSSEVPVTVIIQDQNDNAPQILYPIQSGGSLVAEMVPRAADVGYLVTKVVAVDVDSGQNAWLSYKLQKATDRALFEVGAQNGEIRTARQVTDKDPVKQKLTVVVEDNGQPSRSATVNVNVAVADSFPEVLSEFTDFTHEKEKNENLTFYLVLALAAVSFLFICCLVVIISVKIYRWRQSRLFCQSNLPVIPYYPPHYADAGGAGTLQRMYNYEVCMTTDSRKSDCKFARPSNVLLMDQSCTETIQRAMKDKLSLENSPDEQKPPSNDWRLPPNQRPGPSGQYRFHTIQQRWTPYEKSRAVAHPEGAPAVTGTGPWPNPPTEAEQLQALMAAANEVSEATATLGPRYNAQYVPDYRQNVYIPGSTATLTTNPQQPPQQALPPPQALPPADAPKAAQTPASKKKSAKKDKK